MTTVELQFEGVNVGHEAMVVTFALPFQKVLSVPQLKHLAGLYRELLIKRWEREELPNRWVASACNIIINGGVSGSIVLNTKDTIYQTVPFDKANCPSRFITLAKVLENEVKQTRRLSGATLAIMHRLEPQASFWHYYFPACRGRLFPKMSAARGLTGVV